MLRQAMGDCQVGIRRYETKEIGDDSHRRRVPMTIYYPSESWTKEYPYMEGQYQRSAPNVIDNGVRTYCGMEPEFKTTIVKAKVVLMNHGLCGYEMESTVLCADLASSGYIVVSIGHPYGAGIVTYTDGERFESPESFDDMRKKLDQLEPLWYEDIITVMEWLACANTSNSFWKGKLEVASMGSVGVSFGGCCSVFAALKNDSLRYAVNLDGALFGKPEIRNQDKTILVLCSPLNYKAHAILIKEGCTCVTVKRIRKVSHWEFSDGIYLSDRGKKNTAWANEVSRIRATMIREFIRENTEG